MAETYVNDSSSSVRHQVTTIPVFPGETLTRVRFQYWAGVYAGDFPFIADGVEIALGLRLYPPGEIPVTRFPFTHADDDWLWWETFTFKTDVFWIEEGGNEVSEARGPIDGGYRDAKSQRGPVPGEDAWFLVLQTQASLTTQGAHYLSYGLSALVLDPVV
jgi:hypothetical protein